jgi:isopenicillin-N epimerase
MANNSGQAVDMGKDWRSLWSLDPEITFLNHGSFGACPTAVLEKQNVLRRQMEQEPVRFFALELEELLDAARQELAVFVGADPADLAFVANATTGVNTVLRSLCPSFAPRDELLTTDHEYNASRNALDFVAQLSGATVVVAEVPFPIDTPEQAIAAILSHVSARTRLVLLDHITSQTGLVFPLQPLIQHLTAAGIEVLIDGAHAPGQIPLNLKELGATYYTGNCHKWLSAPKGSAFLYIQPDRHDRLRPLTISHGSNSPRSDRSRFWLEFDWAGTIDPTPYLCVPEAIRWMGSLLPGGWTALMQHNREQALSVRQALCQALAIEPPCPDSMMAAMAVVPLPKGCASSLQAALFSQHQIEVPVNVWHGQTNRLIRVSAQLYNTQSDYDGLIKGLLALLAKEERNV